jgi:two-component sensor histidine kinase
MTNASKYGAFSNGTGKVNFYWSVIRNGRQNKLKFRWQETGGPPVAPPKRRGFGTSLLETTFAAIRLDYPGDGLVCEFEAVLGVEHESQETLA